MFSCGRLRWDSVSAFGASLRNTLLAIGAIAPPRALLWCGNTNQLHPFAAGDKYTLEINYFRSVYSGLSVYNANSVYYGLSNTLFL